MLLHCMLSLVVQCIVISPVCLWICLWVCYHDNSKLCASIFTKLGLYVKVVTISSWLNFGHPVPPGGVCSGVKFFGSALLQPVRSVCISLSAIFHFTIFGKYHVSSWHCYMSCSSIKVWSCWQCNMSDCISNISAAFCFLVIVRKQQSLKLKVTLSTYLLRWIDQLRPKSIHSFSTMAIGLQGQGMHFTGCPWSWKVMEFRKTIFQAWKVMENSKGHRKSWKSHGKWW